ncbi:MAG TPA: hybrid sensor histidine kinase/response regulator [Methanospirillum sp.]|nr:hybrid sensor histidine kinase/response regulator [Methanospirillum sp.]
MDENHEESILNILVVEDNRTQAVFLRHILERAGYRVTVSADATGAVKEVMKSAPSLILSDIIMPGMDGYEFCRSIKQNPLTASIPVILVTHLYDPLDVIKGLESGADNFIIKPYEPETIHAMITRTLLMVGRVDPEECSQPVEIVGSQGTYMISAGRQQAINILLSTYEAAVRKNADLEIVQQKLNALNDQFKEANIELKESNDDLNLVVHECKNVELALAHANKKLQLMTSITRHDLLNQLNSLQGYLELGIMDRESDPEEAWAFVDKASAVVGQLISTVKFTEQYQEIGVHCPVWQNLHQVVDQSVVHTSLESVRFENLIPEDVEIYADSLIEKVFSNLIGNAVSYGGTITTIWFRYEDGNGICKIICEDDGIGIPPEEKEKIFSFQYGIHTGLGLFLSREIVGITGITLSETGRVDEGARFEFLCPDGTIRKINM